MAEVVPPEPPATRRRRSFESDFPDGGPIPVRFTCDGGDASPSIAWRGTG